MERLNKKETIELETVPIESVEIENVDVEYLESSSPEEKKFVEDYIKDDKPLLSDLINESETRVFLREKAGRTYNGIFVDEVLGVIRIKVYDAKVEKFYYYGIHKSLVIGFKIYYSEEESEVQ